jgi:hypothetical protein
MDIAILRVMLVNASLTLEIVKNVQRGALSLILEMDGAMNPVM